mgnify:CR=1 FL=1
MPFPVHAEQANNIRAGSKKHKTLLLMEYLPVFGVLGRKIFALKSLLANILTDRFFFRLSIAVFHHQIYDVRLSGVIFVD